MAELQEFRQYTKAETQGIIAERINYAFFEGVWDKQAQEEVSEKTSKIKDIRSGLFLLKESALIAEDQSKKKVEKGDVEKAIAKLDEFTIKDSANLEDEPKFILEIIKKNSGLKIGDLFKKYEEQGGSSSYKTFQRKIAKLDEGKFIHVTKKTGAGGNTTIIEKKLTDF